MRTIGCLILFSFLALTAYSTKTEHRINLSGTWKFAVDPGNKGIVRVVDDWFTNRPLALLFEAKAGKGKILVSGIDLTTNLDQRPEARQLLFSLKKYMTTDKFNPANAISPESVHNLTGM